MPQAFIINYDLWKSGITGGIQVTYGADWQEGFEGREVEKKYEKIRTSWKNRPAPHMALDINHLSAFFHKN